MDVLPFLAPTFSFSVFRSPCTLGDRSWRRAAQLGFHGLDRRNIVSQSVSQSSWTAVCLLDDDYLETDAKDNITTLSWSSRNVLWTTELNFPSAWGWVHEWIFIFGCTVPLSDVLYIYKIILTSRCSWYLNCFLTCVYDLRTGGGGEMAGQSSYVPIFSLPFVKTH